MGAVIGSNIKVSGVNKGMRILSVRMVFNVD